MKALIAAIILTTMAPASLSVMAKDSSEVSEPSTGLENGKKLGNITIYFVPGHKTSDDYKASHGFRSHWGINNAYMNKIGKTWYIIGISAESDPMGLKGHKVSFKEEDVANIKYND